MRWLIQFQFADSVCGLVSLWLSPSHVNHCQSHTNVVKVFECSYINTIQESRASSWCAAIHYCSSSEMCFISLSTLSHIDLSLWCMTQYQKNTSAQMLTALVHFVSSSKKSTTHSMTSVWVCHKRFLCVNSPKILLMMCEYIFVLSYWFLDVWLWLYLESGW